MYDTGNLYVWLNHISQWLCTLEVSTGYFVFIALLSEVSAHAKHIQVLLHKGLSKLVCRYIAGTKSAVQVLIYCKQV